MFTIAAEKWHWQSDWNGDEVGHPELNAVGLYSMESESTGQTVYIYINAETGEILSIWTSCDCSE